MRRKPRERGEGWQARLYLKVIVLLAGTNNVGTMTPAAGDDGKVADITLGISAPRPRIW